LISLLQNYTFACYPWPILVSVSRPSQRLPSVKFCMRPYVQNFVVDSRL